MMPSLDMSHQFIQMSLICNLFYRQIVKCINECKTQACNAKKLVGNIKDPKKHGNTDRSGIDAKESLPMTTMPLHIQMTMTTTSAGAPTSTTRTKTPTKKSNTQIWLRNITIALNISWMKCLMNIKQSVSA